MHGLYNAFKLKTGAHSLPNHKYIIFGKREGEHFNGPHVTFLINPLAIKVETISTLHLNRSPLISDLLF